MTHTCPECGRKFTDLRYGSGDPRWWDAVDRWTEYHQYECPAETE